MITRLVNQLTFTPLLLLLFMIGCQSSSSSAGGFEDLTASEFEAKMAEEGVVILDVRTPAETAEGIIEGATEIDFRADDFADRIAELDKDASYLVYCRSGGRSASACGMMKEMGFENVYNLVGGYQRWQAGH